MPMTIEEMEAAGKRLEKIRAAQKKLEAERHRLGLINKFCTAGNVWCPELVLNSGDRYGNGQISIKVTLQLGIVQQAAIDAVRKAERELILLGGMP